MSTPGVVLGVLGLCWVDSDNPTQLQALYCAGSGALCWVCWVSPCAQACAYSFSQATDSSCYGVFFSYARTENPNKPNTPNTNILKALFLLVFLCVGCVLGWAFLCWVASGAGETGHD